MPQFDVFLSHNSVDKPWVIKLKDDLQRYGVSVWLDKDEIRPGDLFAKALEEGLENSRAVAIIISPEAAASDWVEAEYYRALSLAQNKHSSLQLIPVILGDAELPGFLEDRNWVDFREESAYSQNVWKLVWGITDNKPAKVLDLGAPNLPSSASVQSARQTEALTANTTTSSSIPGKSQRADISPLDVVAELERLLGVSKDVITVSVTRNGVLRVELPTQAANHLVRMYQENTLRNSLFEVRHLELIRKTSRLANVSDGAQVTRTKDAHTFCVSLSGLVTSGTESQLSLEIENTSSKNFRRVTLTFSAADDSISLRRTEWRFALAASSSHARPLSLRANQPGNYDLPVDVASIPPPTEGFLHSTLPLIVHSPPPTSHIEIKLA